MSSPLYLSKCYTFFMQHFLQSDAWRAFQEALGRRTFIGTGKGWHYMAVLETGRANTRLYCPYGPVCNSPEAFDGALASLLALAKTQGATFIRVEPTEGIDAAELKRRGFKRVTYNQLQPAQTQVITLAGKTAEDVLADMVPSTRNRYRNYQKKGMEIHESNDPADVELFLRFIKKVAKRTHLTPHSDDYFRMQVQALFPLGAGKLFYVTVDGQPAAASISFEGETTRSYAHAAADDDYRKLAPGTVLVAHMILDALAAGKERYDLYGIAPADDPHHPWAGFTKFKQQFGGEPVQYAGTWDLPVQPLVYYGYRSYQILRRTAKRLTKRGR